MVEQVEKIYHVEITYNPFQGLKLLPEFYERINFLVEITYNPFQGLKHKDRTAQFLIQDNC